MAEVTIPNDLQRNFSSDTISISNISETPVLISTDHVTLDSNNAEEPPAKKCKVLLNDKVIQRKNMIDTVSTFTLLNPGNYQVRILHDENGNGIWDTGSLFPTKIQPEIAEFFQNEITIKANWENKIDLRLNDSKKPRLSIEK